MRTRSVTFNCISILLSLILINSCSDSVEPDPPEETDVTVILNPFDAESDSTLSDATHYVAESSDVIAVGEDEVTRPEGTELTVRTEHDNYETTETDITFNRKETVDIPMTAVDTTDPGNGDTVEVTVRAKDGDTGDQLDDLTFGMNDKVIGDEVDQITLTEPRDTTVELMIAREDYKPLTESILFDKNKEITVELEATTAGNVTITYSVRDDAGEAVNSAELMIADTLVATGADGSFELPESSETTAVCGSADWHEGDCIELTPNTDQGIEITLPRETVSISVTPEIVGYTDIYANLEPGVGWDAFVSDNTIYYLSVGDSTRSGAGRAIDSSTKIAEGVTTTIEYPAGPDPIPISIRAEYFPEEGHPYSDEHYLNVAEGHTEVAGDTDSDIELDLEHIPACRDEVDNTFSGRTDAEELGCTDYQTGEYDPEDDVELVKGITGTGTFGHPDYSAYIANAPGKRVGPAGGGSNPPSIQYAMGEVNFWLFVKSDKDDDEQAAAIELRCGADSNNLPDEVTSMTEITHDTEADGWGNIRFHGLTRDSFAGQDYCRYKAVHASKVRGEEAGDGEGRIDIANEETDGFGTVTRSWIYQPEDVPSNESVSGSQAAKTADDRVQETDVLDPEEWMKQPMNK